MYFDLVLKINIYLQCILKRTKKCLFMYERVHTLHKYNAWNKCGGYVMFFSIHKLPHAKHLFYI